jgi:hypothetical protein
VKKVLLSLWVFGAAIYTANSVVIADRLGLLGGVLGTSGMQQAGQTELAEARQPAAEETVPDDALQTAEEEEEENLFPALLEDEGGEWEFEEAERPQARTPSRRAQRRGGSPVGGVAAHFYKQFGR